jgi:CRISPR system Cascade subunit CasA
MISFNLIDQPFIPCLMPDGQMKELGLLECLAKASSIREIRDGSPLVTAALHRLVLAVLHRNFGPSNLSAWKKLWDAGKFDLSILVAYLHRWRGRFDLFDSDYPFFQLAHFSARKSSQINRLAQEMARGNNTTLFDHTNEGAITTMTPSQAARYLVAEQAYAVGGGKSDRGNTTHAPAVAGAIILPCGETLFQTLMLGMVGYNADEPFPASNDVPAWERDSSGVDGGPIPHGYLDYLTWQSRAICLHPEFEDGFAVIRQISYAQGRAFVAPSAFRDPLMAYRRDKERGDHPIRLSENREFWRDSAALFQLSAMDVFKAPRCMNWLSRLIANGALARSRRYTLTVTGICTDKAKVNFWRQDYMPLPLPYLDDVNLVESLRTATGLTEEVANFLRSSIWSVAGYLLNPKDGQPDKNRANAVVNSLSAGLFYWSRLEIPFRRFVLDLPGESQHRQQQLRAWLLDTLRPTAVAAFENTAGRLDRSARVLRAVTAGREKLARSLGTICKSYKEQLHEPAAC